MNLDTNKVQEQDIQAIDRITQQFFDLFTNVDGQRPKIRQIDQIFLTSGILINNTGEEPVLYDLEGFVAPRVKILTDGTLTEFREFETAHETVIHGKIAQRSCQYKKSGKLNGAAYHGEGHKLLQFIKVDDKWMISSVIWMDKN